MPDVPPALPPLHAAWLGALTGVADPRSEPRATCGDCVMCGGVARSGSSVTFSPALKCCSYVPHLANFLAGRALAGPGRGSVLDRIAGRGGVTPLGLGLRHDDVRRMVGARSHFGRSAAVRCPHFDDATQGCGIWETRNAVCSTWFCQHGRGAVGRRFWHAVRDLLIAAEEQVARHCLDAGGLPAEQVDAVVEHRATVRETVRRANAGDDVATAEVDDESPQWFARMWGAWQGREEEWFARCADTMARLPDGDLPGRLVGVGRLVEDVVRRSADLTRHDLPERLLFTPGAGSEASTDVLRLVGYSPFDPLVLPAGLEPGLWLLDGRPVADVLAGIDPSRPTSLDVDVLRRLLDFGVAEATGADVDLLAQESDGRRLLVLDDGRRLDLDGGLDLDEDRGEDVVLG